MKITLISTSITPSDQGIRMLSSLLKKNNHKTQMIFLPYSENYNRLYKKAVLNQILEKCRNSDVVGISAYASTAPRAEQVIRYLKQLNIPPIYGGIHATISPNKCIEHCDIVCIGEGEDALLELITKLDKKKDISRVKNFWIKQNNKIIKNPVRPLRENLDKLPPADYDIKDHWILKREKLLLLKKGHLGV